MNNELTYLNYNFFQLTKIWLGLEIDFSIAHFTGHINKPIWQIVSVMKNPIDFLDRMQIRIRKVEQKRRRKASMGK